MEAFIKKNRSRWENDNIKIKTTKKIEIKKPRGRTVTWRKLQPKKRNQFPKWICPLLCPLLKGKYLLLNRGKYFYEYNFSENKNALICICSLNLLLCQFDQRLNNNLGENKAKKTRKKIASWWSQALKLNSEILLVKCAQETKIGEDKKQGTPAHYLPELPTARFWAVNLLFGDGVDVFGDKLVCAPSPALSYTCAWEKKMRGVKKTFQE